jgi:hypothetical protein
MAKYPPPPQKNFQVPILKFLQVMIDAQRKCEIQGTRCGYYSTVGNYDRDIFHNSDPEIVENGILTRVYIKNKYNVSIFKEYTCLWV